MSVQIYNSTALRGRDRSRGHTSYVLCMLAPPAWQAYCGSDSTEATRVRDLLERFNTAFTDRYTVERATRTAVRTFAIGLQPPLVDSAVPHSLTSYHKVSAA